MKDKELIVNLINTLNIILENAPEEDNLDDNNLIEFYANAQNLKESIERLNISCERDPKQGLYPEEVMELMNYIQENNSWDNMYDCHQKGRETPKYYTMRVDTRTGTVWCVTFDNLIFNKTNSNDGITFRTEQPYKLKEAIYEFLNITHKD